MRKEILGAFVVAFSAIFFAACSKTNWTGETYAGRAYLDGAKAKEDWVEKFQLSTISLPDGKRQRVVILDAGNKLWGDCTIPLDVFDPASSPKMDTQKHSFDGKSGVLCSSGIDGVTMKFEVASAWAVSGAMDVDPGTTDEDKKNMVHFEMTLHKVADSKNFTLHIDAKRQ